MRDNKEFQKLLNKLHTANKKYKDTLAEAERAYQDRYGESASNNDTWVDAFHLDATHLTVKKLDDSVYNMPDNMAKY